MLFSIYPTDTEETRFNVLEQADLCGTKLIFTSLHIPESEKLKNYIEFLAKQKERGFSFFADISPVAIEKLSLTLDRLDELKNCGIKGLRIDFGFSVNEIKIIAKSGLQIAINASTVSEEILESLKHLNIIGWHNYYPRPETGISNEFLVRQNILCASFDIPVYVFIPGEIALRAPLFCGLPTLENQRGKTAWINFMEMSQLAPKSEIVCAEGTLYENHLEWIKDFEKQNIVTIPLCAVDKNLKEKLFSDIHRIRVECTDYSWRVENTRAAIIPEMILRGEEREAGSLQIDLPNYKRYQGEIHIMKKNCPLDGAMSQIAQILPPYKKLAALIQGGCKVRFLAVP